MPVRVRRTWPGCSRLGFLAITDVIEQVLREHVAEAGERPAGDVGSTLVVGAGLTLEAVLAADAWARARASRLVDGRKVASA